MRDFIPNIEKANARVRELEVKIGLPLSASSENIEEVNDHIKLLESYTTRNLLATAAPHAPQTAVPKPAAVEPRRTPADDAGQLTGLRRAVAAAKRQQGATR